MTRTAKCEDVDWYGIDGLARMAVEGTKPFIVKKEWAWEVKWYAGECHKLPKFPSFTAGNFIRGDA